ncbi:hypothetical protein Dform_01279 [Dehalogenimonas formicexedens]|uniref:Uncharacterized protein n=1 Tax=Dehalogenimonas formicexedens TaxID=1839801 RepID=A0A1P8F818_9CHLR|nr:hypothetical protein [Dehalogenimonas formicexedens]APV44607.1 hypothetical protein Dform_01279 [Dehalogenimonas formicexedens]
MAITDWGSPTSIVTLAILILTAIILPLIRWGYSTNLKHNPFKIEHGYKKGSISDPTDADIRGGRAQEALPQNWLRQDQIRLIKHSQKDDRHVIFLELQPRKSWSVDGISLRLVGDDKNKPRLIKISDLNQQSLNITKTYGKRLGDVDIWYSPELHSHKNKTLDYLVQFFTNGEWNGDLVTTIHLFNESSRQLKSFELKVVDETAK